MVRDYQYNYSALADDLYDFKFRQNKAKKTISILVDFLGETSKLNLLDIGCSTGIMTMEYGKHFQHVTGIDLDTNAINHANQINKLINVNYVNAPIEENNFNEASFDVITCSHIYEHVPSEKELIRNIYKLLKPGGVCYFAAGNKFKIIEPHYNIPFLSYFPKIISNFILRIIKGEKYYYENLLSHSKLSKLVSDFEVIDYTLKVIKNPTKFYGNEMLIEGTVKYHFYNFISNYFYFLIPTYIWILKKR